ncbi:MAG: hypothetical protein FWC32_11475 [Firmicutes bacterium]|nr:hypothetical protein [Bacillota bacterium]
MRKLLLVPLFALYLTILSAGGMYISEEIYETVGIVVSLNGNQLHIIGESLTEFGHADVVVDITNARIYNLQTGFPVDISFIGSGMSARVAYNESETALAVWLNCDNENSAVFSVVVSDNIQYGGDYCVFLCTDGKYRVTLSGQTVIIDPHYGELSPIDILPGQELFLWVDMITASSPSLVYPDKVVLIND